MLKEFLTHLFTFTSRHVKEMGYLHELIAISARYKRCRRAWQPHLDASKDFILKAVHSCPHHKKAVILGSGLLLDIPLAELSEAFEEVLLVDIVHLPATKRKASRYPNVFILNADITGAAHAVYKTRRITPIETTTGFPGCDSKTSLLISANLLSQLSLCPASFLIEKCHVNEIDVQKWEKNLVKDHLKRLANLACTVCLLTDRSISCKDKNGKIYDVRDTLHGIRPEMELTNIRYQAKWQWDVAPLGEISNDYSMTLEVMGLICSK